MNITKIGHCCLVVEVDEVKIMVDPGAWTTGQNEIKGLDAILITHEHADHFHVESLRVVLGNNPGVRIYTNSAVGKLLTESGISFELLEEGSEIKVKEVPISAFGKEHGVVYPTIPNVMNTGFLIADRLYYPGDAFVQIKKKVEVLALPVAGPWMKMWEAIDFAKAIQPKIAFPVHDGFLAFPGPFHMLPGKLLPEFGVEFKPLLAGESLQL